MGGYGDGFIVFRGQSAALASDVCLIKDHSQAALLVQCDMYKADMWYKTTNGAKCLSGYMGCRTYCVFLFVIFEHSINIEHSSISHILNIGRWSWFLHRQNSYQAHSCARDRNF